MTVKLAAEAEPKFTVVAPVNPLPVMVTAVPPPVVPELALRLVMAGTGMAVNVNWSAEEVPDVPLGVTTVMSKVPTDCAGEMAVMLVSETTVKLVAATAPKLTALAPVKLLPVIVTVVPPAALPLDGLIAVTLGAGAAVTVNRSPDPVALVPLGVVTVMS